MARSPQEVLEEIVRDIDMVVYRLERPVPSAASGDAAQSEGERREIRRELERLRDVVASLLPTLT